MKTELSEFLEVIKAQGVSVSLNPERQKRPFRCPVCGGAGRVPRSMYEGPVPNSTAIDSTTASCRSCNGGGVLWG